MLFRRSSCGGKTCVSWPSTRLSSSARTLTSCGVSQFAEVKEALFRNEKCVGSVHGSPGPTTQTTTCSMKERIPPVREVRVGSEVTLTTTVSPACGVRVRTMK